MTDSKREVAEQRGEREDFDAEPQIKAWINGTHDQMEFWRRVASSEAESAGLGKTQEQAWNLASYFEGQYDQAIKVRDFLFQKIGTLHIPTAAAPGTGEDDEWRTVESEYPDEGEQVLVAVQFDGPDDWRIKVGQFLPNHPDTGTHGWLVHGASWRPTHWMPMPAAPGRTTAHSLAIATLRAQLAASEARVRELERLLVRAQGSVRNEALAAISELHKGLLLAFLAEIDAALSQSSGGEGV